MAKSSGIFRHLLLKIPISAYLYSFIAGLLANLAWASMPLLLVVLFDSVFPAQNIQHLVLIGSLLVGLGIIYYGLSLIQHIFFSRGLSIVEYDLLQRLWSSILKNREVPVHLSLKTISGSSQTMSTFFQGPIRYIFVDTLSAVCLFLPLFILDLKLAVYAFIPLFVALVAVCVALKLKISSMNRLTTMSDNLVFFITDVLNNITGIKANAQEQTISRQWDTYMPPYLMLHDFSIKAYTFVKQQAMLTSSIVIASFLYFIYFLGHAVTLGEFVAFLYTLLLLSTKIQGLSSHIVKFFRQWPDVVSLLNAVISLESNEGASSLGGSEEVSSAQAPSSYARFDSGRFEASANMLASLGAGQQVALVGGPGSGKTLFIRYVLSQPSSSSIVSILETDTLKAGTILTNILAAETYTKAEVMTAVEKAGLLPILSRFPSGLNTIVTEGGNTFSSGEIEHILLAQALIKQPSYLIIDGKMDNLDSRIRQTVMEALKKEGTTVVYTTNDNALIKLADQTLNIDTMGGKAALKP